MKKDIYKDRLSEIKDLRQAKDKSKLVDLTVKLAKQVNQRFYRLENRGVGVGDTAYKFAQIETDKEKPRYSINKDKLMNLSESELNELLLSLNAKLTSKTSTISGIAEVTDRRLEQSSKALGETLGVDIDKENFKAFLEFGGGQLLNNKYLDSEQIIDDWLEITKSGNVSNKEFIREFKRFKEQKNIDYGKVTRNLKNLASRKNKRASRQR